jgi:hypothetical protein
VNKVYLFVAGCFFSLALVNIANSSAGWAVYCALFCAFSIWQATSKDPS